jgi:O-acetyl-ADP-ribose deacetylase (regulator of RNase III)
LGTKATWETRANIYAIEQSLIKMLLFAKEKNNKNIALPRIGAGLGGLHWKHVKRLIETLEIQYSGIDLYIVENHEM